MSDIVRSIEPFELTQEFGVNEPAYRRFGLAGHNGWDFRTKFPDTPLGKRDILASYNSRFWKQGNEGNDGFGLYFEVITQLKNTWKLTYAHCDSVGKFIEKNEGEKMAVSDNTGNSTGAHLHLTVKKGRLENGQFIVDNYNNGFFGAVNPQIFFDELRAFKKENSSGTIDNMDEDKKRGIANLDKYRKDRKQGPEGNFEGFVNSIIESDRQIEAIKKDKESSNIENQQLKTKIDGLQTAAKVQNEAFESIKAQLEITQKKLKDLTENPPIISPTPVFKKPLAQAIYQVAVLVEG